MYPKVFWIKFGAQIFYKRYKYQMQLNQYNMGEGWPTEKHGETNRHLGIVKEGD
jgi:hypothetical protein